MKHYDAAIVGGGFGGTMAAVNLARLGRGRIGIALFERGGEAGRGVAYGTSDRSHLLNVRAGQMSAFADDPHHFLDWLTHHGDVLHAAGIPEWDANAFLPRLVYGAYIADILAQAQSRYGGIDVIHDDIVDIEQTRGTFHLSSRSGNNIEAGKVVLALGNFPPGERGENPYSPELWDRLAGPGDVLIVGTGLTALDLIVTLATRKTEGIIHLLSRRGLFPQPHAAPGDCPPFFDKAPLPATPLALLRTLRRTVRDAAAEGTSWQVVVDALRHQNQRLWRGMGAEGQRRFLKWLRPFWDTHRHRAAPQIIELKDRLVREGRLVLHQGTFVDSVPADEGCRITWRPAGSDDRDTLVVSQVADCTGPQPDCRKLKDDLMQSLLRRGLVSPPANSIGIAADGYAVCGGDGLVVQGLYAMGTLLKGELYETTAVPELRTQAKEVAATIAGLRQN